LPVAATRRRISSTCDGICTILPTHRNDFGQQYAFHEALNPASWRLLSEISTRLSICSCRLPAHPTLPGLAIPLEHSMNTFFIEAPLTPKVPVFHDNTQTLPVFRWPNGYAEGKICRCRQRGVVHKQTVHIGCGIVPFALCDRGRGIRLSIIR